MDRPKKCVQALVQAVKDLRAKFVKWFNDPRGDYFRSLDSLFIAGAIRYAPGDTWKQICWKFYSFLSILSYFVLLLNFLEQMGHKFDLFYVTWHTITVITSNLSILKCWILCHYHGPIQSARNFINSKNSHSEPGDAQIDAEIRKKFFNKLQVVFYVMLLFDVIFLCTPNSGLDAVYGIPRVIHLIPTLGDGLHLLTAYVLTPVWMGKYCICTGLICFLLSGLKTELAIFTRQFGNIMDRVQSEVLDNLAGSSAGAEDLRQAHRDKLFWKYLKQHVTIKTKQHIELFQSMQMLQPVVQNVFGIIFYNALALIGPFVYLMWSNGISGVSFAFGSFFGTILLECYWWCTVIESIEDEKETLETEVMNLIGTIPYTEEYHKDYVALRTELLIMMINVGNNGRFSCGGVFDITMEAFAELLDISYTVLTFLQNMGNMV